VLDQVDAAIVGIGHDRIDDSVTLYIQNLTSVARVLTLGFGLLAWDEALRVDFLGRDMGDAVTPVPDGVASEAPPWGVIAIRLAGLRLRNGG
jgi:hypothetical protein